LGLVRLGRHEAGSWRRRDGRLLLCAGYFLVVSVVAASPPRLRAPLDVLFLVGASTLVVAWIERRRQSRAGDHNVVAVAIRGRDVSRRPRGVGVRL